MKKHNDEGTAVSNEPQQTTAAATKRAGRKERFLNWCNEHHIGLAITAVGIVTCVSVSIYLQYRSGVSITDAAAQAIGDAASTVE